MVIVSAYAPFSSQRLFDSIEQLEKKLREKRHHIEKIFLPFVASPQGLLEQVVAFRLMDLTESADKVISFNFPAHVVLHPNKVTWFTEEWDAYYKEELKLASTRENSFYSQINSVNAQALKEAQRVFSASPVIAEQIRIYSGFETKILYHPLTNSEFFYCDGYNDGAAAQRILDPSITWEYVMEQLLS